MPRALPLVALLILAGCGSSPGALLTHTPKRAPRTTGEQVARGWADALRRGDVDAAAGFFALPAVVQNGTPPLRLRTRRAIRNFNVALPCGAQFLRARAHHGYVLVTFRLVDRPGPGATHPCQGKGATAATAFLIRGGKIVEWRRALVPGEKARPRARPTPGSLS